MPFPKLRTAALTILALGACVLAPQADAQSRPGTASVSGTVTDSRTGAPLHGATVRFTNLRRSTVTDETGSFSFRGVPVGEQAVSIHMIGYENVLELWAVGDGGAEHLTFHVSLEGRPILLEGLQVQVDRLERRRRSVGVSARVLERDALIGASGLDVKTAISGRMGVLFVPCSSSSGADRGCVLVRGTTSRPTVYIDERLAMGGMDELTGYRADEVYRVEAMAGGRHIRVYTTWFMESIASRPGYRPLPLVVH